MIWIWILIPTLNLNSNLNLNLKKVIIFVEHGSMLCYSLCVHILEYIGLYVLMNLVANFIKVVCRGVHISTSEGEIQWENGVTPAGGGGGGGGGTGCLPPMHGKHFLHLGYTEINVLYMVFMVLTPKSWGDKMIWSPPPHFWK